MYDKLEAFDGELIFKDVLAEDVDDKYKDAKATLEVTVDKDVKVSLDLVHPVMVGRHGNSTLPHSSQNLDDRRVLVANLRQH